VSIFIKYSYIKAATQYSSQHAMLVLSIQQWPAPRIRATDRSAQVRVEPLESVMSRGLLCHLLTDIDSALFNGAPVCNLRYGCICRIIYDLRMLLQKMISLVFVIRKSSYKHVSDFRWLQSNGRL